MQKKRESASVRSAEPKKTAEKKADGKTEKKEKTPGMALRIIGICLLAIGTIIALDFAASSLQGYYTMLEDLFAGLGFLASGGIMLGRGEYLAKMSRRTKRYILAIGAAETMPLDEIAKRVNRTVAQAKKELENLIEKGYLGEDAYIDHEHDCFARFGATIEERPVVTEVPKEAQEGYSGILRNLRVANDRIPDAELSEKIERLEQISALIFKEVEAHPEKRERIRTFFDYYLPTTQKLLDTYAEFDEMGVEGENLTNAKERIEQMMDAIVEGIEHQLDQLYSADAMDVVSDIKVMESMLSRDTASAAKDFGYAKATKPAGKDELKPQQMEM
ncbi:MAG: 5-bromo-4-chloroindolyl phosphate hydrolysis family protein [Oscillospiraceae bacterium]|nr:5-bromo-4-chloroindolyl phosphate hydrolysis family protein [Oscillospiraceae bacterium]